MRRSSTMLGHVLTVGVCAVVALAWALLILGESGSLPDLGSDSYEVNAVVPTSVRLTTGARVTMAGVEVGRVDAIDRTASGRGTRVRMRLDDDRVVPVPRESRVQIRTRTQVGENYIAIVPSKSDWSLASGEYLDVEDVDEHVAVDEVLSVLQGDTKTRAREALTALGEGLDGRGGALNRTFAGVDRTIETSSDLVAALHRRRRAVTSLVDEVGRVMAAVGERGEAIDAIAGRGIVAFRAIGDRDEALSRTLEELPGSLEQIERTSRSLGVVSREGVPVVDELSLASREARGLVRRIGPSSREGLRVLRALAKASPGLEGVLAATRALSEPLVEALPEVEAATCELNPILRYFVPYKEDLLMVLVGLGSASNSYDATGHLVRLAPILNENSLSGAPDEVNSAMDTLLQSGLLMKSKVIRYDPYMKPGVIGTTKAEPGDPTGPESLGESGYVYPRVKADC